MGDIRLGGKTLGQLAFEAYRAEVNGQTFDDRQIPEWGELHGNRERVHRGWEAAAEAVTKEVRASDLSERAFDEAYGGPTVRRGYRPQKSRAIPLQFEAPGPLDDAPVTGLNQVGGERAARARRVEVGADDETGDDAS